MILPPRIVVAQALGLGALMALLAAVVAVAAAITAALALLLFFAALDMLVGPALDWLIHRLRSRS